MTSPGTSKGDEEFAWKTATGIMLFLSIATILLRVLGLFGPQADPLFVFTVWIPTIVLIVVWLKGQPKPESTGDLNPPPVVVGRS